MLYSKYYSELHGEAKTRYKDKIRLISYEKDPFCHLEVVNSSLHGLQWYEWPDVTYPDVYNYLINTPSFCTHEQLKAYKSMDGYNLYSSGWVSDLTVIGNQIARPKVFIFMALVKHSQSLSVPPLKVWVATRQNGVVLCAHCRCMAGIGEACSHVAVLLFAAEANTQLKSQHSSTSLPCSWLPPSFRSVPFAEVSDIDFTSPSLKRKLSLQVAGNGESTSNGESTQPSKKVFITKPTEDDIDDFYKELSKCEGKPAVLSLIPNYNQAYIPIYETGCLMKPLTELHDPAAMMMEYPALLKKCEEVYETVSFSFNQANLVEEMTRTQADSKLWFQQRAGRITASKLRDVLHTDYSQPSISMIQSICYPTSYKFTSVACQYGCDHEHVAREKYVTEHSKVHESFFVIKCGLILHPSHPLVSASPDGIVNCSCCGTSTLEIKCPFRCKEKSFEEVVQSQSSFCLEMEGDSLKLKNDHPYYYQVQLQMKICQVDYSDFVVWREDNIFVQRIPIDMEFIDDAIENVQPFIKLALLPELVGKWFSKQNVVPLTRDNPNDQPISSAAEVWCYCKKGEDHGDMIGCDYKNCQIQWFHLSCLKSTKTQVPKGKWYCPDCHKCRKGKGKKK